MSQTARMLPARPLSITGVGVASPAGLGLPALASALRGDPVAAASPPPAPEPGDYPPDPVRPVPDLDFTEHLGRKGVRHLDRTTKLGLLACRQALAQSSAPAAGPATGVVIGTSTGSIRSSAEFCLDTLIHDRPYLVNASTFPNTVMNCCAGQIAIWNSLRGVNATLAGGQLSSLFALRYARNALSQGQASRLLVGGVEELSPQSAWAWHHLGALKPGAAVGEGCAVFAVCYGTAPPDEADPGAAGAPLAQLLSCEVAYHGGPAYRGRRAEGLAEVVGRALRRSGVEPQQVDLVSLGATNHTGLQRIEERGLRLALGRQPTRRLQVKDVLGECFSASGAMQLAALLAVWQDTAAASGQVGLVTSVGPDGNVGCLVVRGPAGSGHAG